MFKELVKVINGCSLQITLQQNEATNTNGTITGMVSIIGKDKTYPVVSFTGTPEELDEKFHEIVKPVEKQLILVKEIEVKKEEVKPIAKKADKKSEPVIPTPTPVPVPVQQETLFNNVDTAPVSSAPSEKPTKEEIKEVISAETELDPDSEPEFEPEPEYEPEDPELF